MIIFILCVCLILFWYTYYILFNTDIELKKSANITLSKVIIQLIIVFMTILIVKMIFHL